MTLRLDKFHELLQDCSLYHPFHPTLVENGFDNWEAVSDLNEEILHSIGIHFMLKYALFTYLLS